VRGDDPVRILVVVGPSGQSVTWFIANPDNPFDPFREGYLATNPTVGRDWAAKDEGFAGIIYGTPTGGPENSLKLYL
jgi:hypothetical protein